jgi:hypothetical protein
MRKNKLNAYFIFLSVIFMQLITVNAVEKSTAAVGMGGLIIGRLKLDVGDLNSMLTKYGYPEIPQKLFLFGGCGYGIVDGTQIMGGYGFIGGFNKGLGNRFISLGYGGGGFASGLGYNTRETFVGIMLTIGGFGMDLKLTKRPEKLSSAEEILDEPSVTSTSHINGGALYISLGVIANYRTGNSIIGMNFGKMFFPGFKWKTELGTELLDLPAIKSARYCFLDLLWGGEKKENEK